MTDQMTPDELRAVASRIRYRLAMLGGTSADGADMLNGPNAIDRLADAIEQCEKALSDERYDRQRNAFLWIAGIARGETNERETP